MKSELTDWLRERTVKAQLMDGVSVDRRYMALTNKLKNAMIEHYQWFEKYLEEHPEPPLPYHENFGITEEEYEELQGLSQKINMISTAEDTVKIIHKDNLILFESKGKLAFLQNLKVDMDSCKVYIDNDQLRFIRIVNIEDANNGLNSKWTGYRWEFKEPENFSALLLGNLSELTGSYYDLIIGRLEKDNKTYISLQAHSIKDGEIISKIKIPIIF